jgi:redox-sensing transcriptional repressor
VAERLVAVGVRSLLNFAPRVLQLGPGVRVRQVDLSTELQVMSFYELRDEASQL